MVLHDVDVADGDIEQLWSVSIILQDFPSVLVIWIYYVFLIVSWYLSRHTDAGSTLRPVLLEVKWRPSWVGLLRKLVRPGALR